jgi:hypothetical protein
VRFATPRNVAKQAEEQQVGRKDTEGVATIRVSRIDLDRRTPASSSAIETPQDDIEN